MYVMLVTATAPYKYEYVININIYIYIKIHKTHTEHLFTRLLRTGSCTLEFLHKMIWKSSCLLAHRKQYIDLNFLSHFLSKKGLCEKASTFTFTPEKTKACIMSCIMSFIMSHSVRYVTEREELQERIWGQNKCIYFFVCSLFRIYLTITQINLR